MTPFIAIAILYAIILFVILWWIFGVIHAIEITATIAAFFALLFFLFPSPLTGV